MVEEKKKEYHVKEGLKKYVTGHSNWIARFFSILFISTILGVICGFTMVGFNYLLILFSFGFSFLPYFLSPLIAGALTSLVVKMGVKKNLFRIMGTGATQFVEEVSEPALSYERGPILLGKTFATSWTFGSGMVCGKEGPGLLIGANLGHILSKRFKRYELHKHDYYFIGASACTSAILRAPISGALFCAELPYSNHIRYTSLLPSIFASTIAFLIFSLFFGYEPLIPLNLSILGQINYVTLLPLLIFFGIFIGIISFLFIHLMKSWQELLKNKFRGRRGFWTLPLIGGALYSIFLFIIIPYMGCDLHNVLIHPDTDFLTFFTTAVENTCMELLIPLTLLFVLAILFSIGFYNSAGIILPLMVLGALVGGIFGVYFFPEYPELFVILGISAMLGASINNPVTAIIIIVEMTWEPFLFIPAGIATIIAYIFSGPSAIIPGQKIVKEIETFDEDQVVIEG